MQNGRTGPAVLAAKDILGQSDYEQDVRKHLMPYVRTSVANRWLMNRVGRSDVQTNVQGVDEGPEETWTTALI